MGDISAPYVILSFQYSSWDVFAMQAASGVHPGLCHIKFLKFHKSETSITGKPTENIHKPTAWLSKRWLEHNDISLGYKKLLRITNRPVMERCVNGASYYWILISTFTDMALPGLIDSVKCITHFFAREKYQGNKHCLQSIDTKKLMGYTVHMK